MKSRLRILGSHKGKLELVLSVTRSPNEDAKDLHGIPGTISGTIGQFVQIDPPISPLESTARP